MPDARIELLTWSGCPSHDSAVERLESALAELGRADEPVAVRWIETDEDAAAERFAGSPTIRVDGTDVVPLAPDDAFGLTCRVYRTRAGTFSPLPDRAQLAERLAELLEASA